VSAGKLDAADTLTRFEQAVRADMVAILAGTPTPPATAQAHRVRLAAHVALDWEHHKHDADIRLLQTLAESPECGDWDREARADDQCRRDTGGM